MNPLSPNETSLDFRFSIPLEHICRHDDTAFKRANSLLDLQIIFTALWLLAAAAKTLDSSWGSLNSSGIRRIIFIVFRYLFRLVYYYYFFLRVFLFIRVYVFMHAYIRIRVYFLHFFFLNGFRLNVRDNGAASVAVTIFLSSFTLSLLPYWRNYYYLVIILGVCLTRTFGIEGKDESPRYSVSFVRNSIARPNAIRFLSNWKFSRKRDVLRTLFFLLLFHRVSRRGQTIVLGYSDLARTKKEQLC